MFHLCPHPTHLHVSSQRHFVSLRTDSEHSGAHVGEAKAGMWRACFWKAIALEGLTHYLGIFEYYDSIRYRNIPT